jgi:hypothetical protein
MEIGMTIKIGEYRSKKFYKLGAKLVDIRVMLDELSRVRGRNEKDIERLENARRYAMKVSAGVLSDVIWELNMEHVERLSEDPEWRREQAESAHQIVKEYEEQKDSEWHKRFEEADDNAGDKS